MKHLFTTKQLLIFLIYFLFFGTIIVEYLPALQNIEDFLEAPYLTLSIGKSSITTFLAIKTFLTFAIIILLAGRLVLFGKARIMGIKGIGNSGKLLLAKLFQIIFYFLFFVTGLTFVGIDLTALAVLGGGIGIGLGFGLQKIASNFISGIILLYEQSVRIGDLIELSDGTLGHIRRIETRYILLETFDGREIIIPNEDMVTLRVINWTLSSNKRRVKIDVGVAYNSPLQDVHEIILGCALAHPKCLKDPEPACLLIEFGDNSVNYVLYFWVGDVNYGFFAVRSEVMLAIWDTFNKKGINIPFPQRDVHIIPAIQNKNKIEKSSKKKSVKKIEKNKIENKIEKKSVKIKIKKPAKRKA